MTSGVPGGDPDTDDDATLGFGVDELIIRYFVAFIKLVAFVAFPPLALYRDPIEGFWRWRRIYAVFLVGTALVFLPSVLTGEFGVLVLFPFFHLIAFALVAEVVAVSLLPVVAPTVSIPKFPPVPIRASVVAVAGFVFAVLILLRRGVPFFGRGSDDPEYKILMTEVWKSGGKHD